MLNWVTKKQYYRLIADLLCTYLAHYEARIGCYKVAFKWQIGCGSKIIMRPIEPTLMLICGTKNVAFQCCYKGFNTKSHTKPLINKDLIYFSNILCPAIIRPECKRLPIDCAVCRDISQHLFPNTLCVCVGPINTNTHHCLALNQK